MEGRRKGVVELIGKKGFTRSEDSGEAAAGGDDEEDVA